MYITTPTLSGTDSMNIINICFLLEPLTFVVCFSTTTTQGRLLLPSLLYVLRLEVHFFI